MASFTSHKRRSWNPLTALYQYYDNTRAYQMLPINDDDSLLHIPPRAATSSPHRKYRHLNPPHRFGRPTCSRLALLIVLAIIIFTIAGGGRWNGASDEDEGPPMPPFKWEAFHRYWGYFNGVKTLVDYDDYHAENPDNNPHETFSLAGPRLTKITKPTFANTTLPLRLRVFDPYPDYTSPGYLNEHHPVEECYLGNDGNTPTPDVFVFPGVPQSMPYPIFGSYKELELRQDVCFERYGRLGPYGWGYPREEGGLFIFNISDIEHEGIDELWELQPKINYALADWGKLQKTCYEKNKIRFHTIGGGDTAAAADTRVPTKKKLPRTAFVLRGWTGCLWSDFEMASVRAMVTELALKSGGEYDVHLLVDVKDGTIPIWASDEVYQQTMEAFVPREFWGITTMWSQSLMKLYYPGPFNFTVENFSKQDMYDTYRSGHWGLQWFAQQHPEYDFIWNWEMDVRFTGHYYDYFEKLGKWAKKQPRKGLWERSAKFWMPSVHGDYNNFTKLVESEIANSVNGSVWGPVKFNNSGIVKTPDDCYPKTTYHQDQYEWGVGEDADLITFNPIFNPDETIWVFRKDITGYDPNLPIPPRRTSVVTTSRFSKRLLNLMHEETYKLRHSAFPEMWPATCSLHHGLKAVYAPHPVYFDRQWPTDHMNQVFNYPENAKQSPFGYGEHNLKGSTFYYDSWFAGKLWRRWLGEQDNREGGPKSEMKGTGRMCLRSTLHHPIKQE